MEGNHRQISSQMIQLIFHPEMDIKPLCHKNNGHYQHLKEFCGQDFVVKHTQLKSFLFCFICKNITGLSE